MAYTSLFVHLVWSTKHRAPLLNRALRRELFPYIGGIVRQVDAHPEIVNGVSDHVHLLARLPATLSIAEFAQRVKGSSAHWANETAQRKVLKWQVKYGAFSVNPRDISVVRRYIANQEAHHGETAYEDELKRMLDEAGVEYDEKFLLE